MTMPRSKPTRPGELVQIDTLFVNVRPDRAVKHFTAYDPVAKWTLATVAGRATAACAETLIAKLIAEAPFPIQGIQVDGGSEFRAAFERACQDKGLALFAEPAHPLARQIGSMASLPLRAAPLQPCCDGALASTKARRVAAHAGAAVVRADTTLVITTPKELSCARVLELNLHKGAACLCRKQN
jgi:hypothetical protein